MGTTSTREKSSLSNFIVDEFIRLFKYMNEIAYNPKIRTFDPLKTRRFKSCPLLHTLSEILSRKISKHSDNVISYWDQKYYAEYVGRKMLSLLFSINFIEPNYGPSYGVEYVNIDEVHMEFLQKTFVFRKKFFNNELGLNKSTTPEIIEDLENKFIKFIFDSFIENLDKFTLFITDSNYSLKKIYQTKHKRKKSSIYVNNNQIQNSCTILSINTSDFLIGRI